ncbi:MAG: hypothetical protein JST21_03160 [Bacteroidetes bacterium]|nr:hypothetical protein [Bacteroidota bacterium]
MAKIIVVTNFSASSRNALDYACRFLHNPTTSVLLLNIFSFPATFNNDAITIAAMSEVISGDERKLQLEYEWVKKNYPEINIRKEMVTGVFLDELRYKIAEEETKLVVMGASGSYSELLSWDVNIVDAFIDLTIPVLIIPQEMSYRPIKKIAFAVNFYRKNLQLPAATISRILSYTKAQLFIIQVMGPAEVVDEVALANQRSFKEGLTEFSPVYFKPSFENLFEDIDAFTASENIDLMFVIPSRHGLWYRLSQQQTKGLSYINHIPVLSLRQGKEFL